MFNPGLFLNSRPDGFGVLEISGHETEPPRFVPLIKTVLQGDVMGPFADLRLTQHFRFAAESWPEPVEALYRFPLPGDAAVTGSSVTFGDVRIEATLVSREEAEAQYAEAKAAGKQAALAMREAPDVFTLMVAGIRPDQEVRVETSFVLLARRDGPDWTMRIPLTTAPRYIREDERTGRHAHGQPLAVLRDPGHRFSLDLHMQGAADVASPTHELALTQGGNSIQVTLAAGEVLPDRDCVLHWRLPQAETRPTLDVQCHVAHEEDGIYLLASIAPPAAAPEPGPAREVILLVDHSGSMHGPKWQAADWAVEAFLRGMAARDAFALACFHNDCAWQTPTLQQATPEQIDAAVAWLKGQRESGGTNLGVALEQAVNLTPAPGDRTRHILIMTDAQVSDAGRILRLVEEAAQGAAPRRVSVLCIDAAPNDALVNEMVRRSGGIARFLTSDPHEEDITTALDGVLATWAEPMLAGLRLAVDRPALTGARRQAPAPDGWSALDAGDLPAGQAVWLAARAPQGEAAPLRVRLLADDGTVLAEQEVDLAHVAAHAGLLALYGAPRINALEYLIHAHYDPAVLEGEIAKLGFAIDDLALEKTGQLYAENRAQAVAAALRDLLTAEALRYGLPSAETAFVAVRQEAGEPVTRTVAVANALPHGWQFPGRGMVGYGATAMGMQAQAMPRSMGNMGGMPADAMAFAQPQPSLMAMPATGGGIGALRTEPAYHPLFTGKPVWHSGRSLLYEGDPAAGEEMTLRGVRASLQGGPQAAEPADDLVLLIYVDDLTQASARVRLEDLLRMGERPLNLYKRAGALVRLELVDPEGSLDAVGIGLKVSLAW
jgi:Ca-activated chloride channel family protein